MIAALTDLQRAQIKIIDLDNPPPFIRVVRDITNIAEIYTAPTPDTTGWVYAHDWGDAAIMFGLQAALLPAGMEAEKIDYCTVKKSPSTGQVKDFGISEANTERVQRFLNTPHAGNFITAVVALAGTSLQNLPGLSRCSIKLRFESQNLTNGGKLNTEMHVDRNATVRAFFGTEFGNMIMPDIAAAEAAGFVFGQDDRPVTVPDLIKARIPVWSAPLGTVPFIRHNERPCNELGPLNWHAVYEIPKNPTHSRPCFTLDFS